MGGIVPLNLRLLGLWPGIDHSTLTRVLSPMAAAGLALAAGMGALLFSVRATEYAAQPLLAVKLALVLTGTAAALRLHLRHGIWLDRAPTTTLRRHAALSLFCWLTALFCGRFLAFVM